MMKYKQMLLQEVDTVKTQVRSCYTAIANRTISEPDAVRKLTDAENRLDKIIMLLEREQ